MALGKGSKDPCVQESGLPEVCFDASYGADKVFVHLHKKGKDDFVICFANDGRKRPITQNLNRKTLEHALETKVLVVNSKITLTEFASRGISKILRKK